jgi:hypothetical protein
MLTRKGILYEVKINNYSSWGKEGLSLPSASSLAFTTYLDTSRSSRPTSAKETSSIAISNKSDSSTTIGARGFLGGIVESYITIYISFYFI